MGWKWLARNMSSLPEWDLACETGLVLYTDESCLVKKKASELIWPFQHTGCVVSHVQLPPKADTQIKSRWNRPPKKPGIFEFLEFLKLVAHDRTIQMKVVSITEKDQNIFFFMAKYKKFARFRPNMVIFWSVHSIALKIFGDGPTCTNHGWIIISR